MTSTTNGNPTGPLPVTNDPHQPPPRGRHRVDPAHPERWNASTLCAPRTPNRGIRVVRTAATT
jgi:hypothetical protein